MFHPLDADLSAITKQMVDMELIHAMPSTSTGNKRSTSLAVVPNTSTTDERQIRTRIAVDNSATSGNITPSSPGSDIDINTNEATRGGSTFEMVRYCDHWEIIRNNYEFEGFSSKYSKV